MIELFLILVGGDWSHLSPTEREFFQRPAISRCCSEADGVRTIYDIRDNSYWVPNPYGTEWLRVPDSAVITEPNPTHEGIVWMFGQSSSIRCFVPGDSY